VVGVDDLGQFCETGLMVFLVLFGLALIGGGAWFFWTRGGGVEED
jgi:hypothetical protein